MTTRESYLPELVQLRAQLERNAAAHRRRVQFKTAPWGGLRTQSDTTTILGYRDADYAVYAAAEKKAGRTPIAKDKWRPIAAFGTSYHNYGAAFDAEPTSIDGIDIHVTPTPAAIWRTDPKRAAQLAQAAQDVLDEVKPAGLRSGDSFNDEPHFELAVTLNTARAMWGNYQETGSSTGTAPTSGSSSSAPTSADSSSSSSSSTQQTQRSESGSAALEILGAIAIVGGLGLLIRSLRGG